MAVDNMRRRIELRLRGELLRDWCRQLAQEDDSVAFDDAWCSGERAIRFSTESIDALVMGWRGAGDVWGLGRLALYEIQNDDEGVSLSLCLSLQGMPDKVKRRVVQLLESGSDGLSTAHKDDSRMLLVRTWQIGDNAASANDVLDSLDMVWKNQARAFDECLREQEPGLPLAEGATLAVISNRFERNMKARALCIEAHGTTCAVCGFDFGVTYGKEFAGIIDVHHRLPLSQIRTDYVVDPVRDLVPVCPNCHRALHSKPDGGVYTVEELKRIVQKRQSPLDG